MDNFEDDIAWLRSSFRPLPRPALPDDCIEYSLYHFAKSDVGKPQIDARSDLRNVQKEATRLQRLWLKDYIWQREPFALELLTENGEVGQLSDAIIGSNTDFEKDLTSLRGRTEYGDSIEDEWVIVWLLRELTKIFPNLWVKVSDTDGEFLLIEASGTLPPWLEPDVADNRVWINDGQLKIIKLAKGSKGRGGTVEKLTLADANSLILNDPQIMMHSASIEEEAFYRLRNYPGQIEKNMHHTVARIPRKVAFLLLQRPAYVAPAVEAFYLRDPIALKSLQGKGSEGKVLFPPSDFTNLCVKFPRPAYAQLRCQDFPVPDNWKSSMPKMGDTLALADADLGMRLTCGFEMLLSDRQYQDRPMVREMHLLLDDLESGDAVLPSDTELEKLGERRDNEEWMDISIDDLQSEMKPSNRGTDKTSSKKKPEFSDKAAQENLQRIVKQFEAFLNTDSAQDQFGLYEDGNSDTDDLDDLDSDDLDEDKEASFAEADFEKLMQEMMGLPPEAMAEIRRGDIDALKNSVAPSTSPASQIRHSTDERLSMSNGKRSTSDSIDDEDEDEDEEDNDAAMKEIMERMGRELSSLGALDISAPESSRSRQIDSKSNLNSSKATGTHPQTGHHDSDEEMDLNFTRNMLESFRSQNGGPGPASNVMDLLLTEQLATDTRSKSRGKEPSRFKPHKDMFEDVD